MLDRSLLNELYKRWLEWADRHYIAARMLSMATLFHDAYLMQWMAIEKVTKLALLVKEENPVFEGAVGPKAYYDAMNSYAKKYSHGGGRMLTRLQECYPELLSQTHFDFALQVYEGFEWRYPLNEGLVLNKFCSTFDYVYLRIRMQKPSDVEGIIEWFLKDVWVSDWLAIQRSALFHDNHYLCPSEGFRNM